MGTVTYLYKVEKAERFELGKGEWFHIQGPEQNMVIFKIADVWTEESLTRFVRKALSPHWAIATDEAVLTAKRIIEWCGADPVVQIADTFDAKEELAELGIRPKRVYRDTGTRWDIYKTGVEEKRLTPQEVIENDELRNELFGEQQAMWDRELQRLKEIDASRLVD